MQNFYGSKDIKRQKPNVEAIKNGAEIIPVMTEVKLS